MRLLLLSSMVGACVSDAVVENPADEFEIDLDVAHAYGANGSEGLWFGGVDDVAIGDDGEIVVLDLSVPTVLRLSLGGQVLSVYGQRGEGPGEYTDVSGLALLGDTVLVRDPNRAIMFFTLDGELVKEWRHAGTWLGERPLAALADGTVLVKEARDDRAWVESTLSLVELGPSGPDPADAFVPAYEPYASGTNFLPEHFVESTPDGGFVLVDGGTYELTLYTSEGEVRRRVSVPFEDVPLLAEEWDWWRRLFARFDAGGNRPPVPGAKPPVRGVVPSRTGEILVVRGVRSISLTGEVAAPETAVEVPWQEPLLIDVFSDDGRLCRRLHGPPGSTLFAASGDSLWTAVVVDGLTPTVQVLVAPRRDGNLCLEEGET